jgi:hypothetical protein
MYNMPQKAKAPRERRVVVYLSKAQYHALLKKQEETGAPFSEIIRRALRAYLALR